MSVQLGALKQTAQFGQYYVMKLGTDADLAAQPETSVDP